MTTRVLLAEDNSALAQMLQTFLAEQGLETIRAATGLETMQCLASEQVDLLLLDLKLPEPNGVEILQKLRQTPRWASLPVIVITGVYKGERYAQAARKLGVSHYLEKPFTRQAFLSAVQSVVAELPAKGGVENLFTRLLTIYQMRQSGSLCLPQGIKVAFLQGEPVSFLSAEGHSFPSYLVSTGKISAEDVTLFMESGQGRIFFTETGLLTYDDLIDESRLFLTAALFSSLREPEAQFIEAGSPELEFPLTPLSVPRLIYQATKETSTPFDAEQFSLRYGSQFPCKTKVFYRLSNLLTLRREDIGFLGQLDPRRSLAQITSGTEAPVEAAGFFNFLFSLGMITFHAIPSTDEQADFIQRNLFNRPMEELNAAEELAVGFDDLVEEVSGTLELVVGTESMAAPLSSEDINFEQTVQHEYRAIQDKNYYELFGLNPNSFSFNALKDAYFAKTRLYSPEKFMELSGATMNTAQEILSHYANAYNTLSSVIAKERYDEMLNADMTVGLDGKQDDKLQARIQFQSGNVFIAMGEYENAEKALQDAYTLEPDNASHCALLALAIYRNPANRSSKAALDKAKMLLAKSLQIEKNAEAFALRGMMLMDEGREGLAEGEFQKALKLNAKESNARKGLQLIAEKREADKKGLFRRMFS